MEKANETFSRAEKSAKMTEKCIPSQMIPDIRCTWEKKKSFISLMLYVLKYVNRESLRAIENDWKTNCTSLVQDKENMRMSADFSSILKYFCDEDINVVDR